MCRQQGCAIGREFLDHMRMLGLCPLIVIDMNVNSVLFILCVLWQILVRLQIP